MDTTAFTGARGLKRLLGVAVVAVCVFLLDLSVADSMHQLWIPLGLALGAYLVTESRLAVLLATGLLAALHMDLASQFWWESLAYPMLALGCAVTGVVLGVRQFRQRIATTHDERWAGRRSDRGNAGP